MELTQHAMELWGATELFQDFPEPFSAHSVEHFGQVTVCYIHYFIVLPRFFLSDNKDRGSEATLALKKVVFCDDRYQFVH